MGLKERLEQQKTQGQVAETGVGDAQGAAGQVPVDANADLKAKIHQLVIDALNQAESGSAAQARGLDNPEAISALIDDLLDREAAGLSRPDKARLSREVLNEVVGFGPLEPLLADPDITEIMVNGPYRIFIEKAGRLEASDVHFRDDAHVLHIIDRIVSSIGRHVDEASPMVDARLPDGSRVNCIIPPLSLSGPVITIRKFSRKALDMTDLVRFGSLSTHMASLLEACVRGRLNILVSGGTGSGKTTLLNALSGYIPEQERIVTIEDAAELKLRQRHVVSLESRPPNLEGRGHISIRDLVRNALRMRPDRIIVGEVRSGEALDMLQAMNTGHDGSLTTGHANSPRDMLSRLETMVLMAGMDLPIRAIREQIASAIDLIIHQARLRDGSRRLTSITEVVGMEGDVITLQELFAFETEGLDGLGRFKGRYKSTGIRPAFTEKLRSNGVLLHDEWFL